MSSIRIYENKTFKLNNVLKYELHSADENVKALHRVRTVCRREWQNKTKRRGGIKMYKVLYIGFLTFQLISVFCNLKSSKKDILEAHNSRKFNIIGIVCQIIAVIFIMIILKM